MTKSESESQTQTGGKKGGAKKGGAKKGGAKKKMNEYFTLMNDARKNNKSSFMYKGNKYVQTTSKTGLKVYKKE